METRWTSVGLRSSLKRVKDGESAWTLIRTRDVTEIVIHLPTEDRAASLAWFDEDIAANGAYSAIRGSRSSALAFSFAHIRPYPIAPSFSIALSVITMTSIPFLPPFNMDFFAHFLRVPSSSTHRLEVVCGPGAGFDKLPIRELTEAGVYYANSKRICTRLAWFSLAHRFSHMR